MQSLDNAGERRSRRQQKWSVLAFAVFGVGLVLAFAVFGVGLVLAIAVFGLGLCSGIRRFRLGLSVGFGLTRAGGDDSLAVYRKQALDGFIIMLLELMPRRLECLRTVESDRNL